MAKIFFTEPAEYNLFETKYYIEVRLSNKESATRIINGIMSTIKVLEKFPESYALSHDELLSNLSIRMTWFDNYNIFYTYNKQTDKVYILRILYHKSEWDSVIKR